jgi:hypothetical protein
MENKETWLADRATERAQWFYTQAYKRWALELSHDKNVVIAKDIAIFVVNELWSYTEDDFWTDVRKLIIESPHKTLYKP